MSERPEESDPDPAGDEPEAAPQELWTCRACRVDVGVDAGLEPRCPRCGGALEAPTLPEGDATDRTLLEVRRPRPSERTLRVPVEVPGDPTPTGAPPRAPAEPASPAPRRGGRPGESGDDDTDPRAGARPSGGSSRLDTATQRDPRLGPAAGAPPAPGPAGREPALRRLGPYELRRVLGKGGMGVVYEAFQPALGRTVALKVMSTSDASDEELARFLREARAAAKLQHPNVVPIYDVGEAEGRRYFTMELVPGRTLQEVARSGTLVPLEAARLVAKVAQAIHFAHTNGVIHRDLKPSNVLVDPLGEPHVMDFGLAKDQADASGLTLSGIAMGSPPYMPPEQARGDFRRVDAVSDVYGLGAVLYECLTGGPPFQGKSVYDVIAKVLVEEPVPPRRRNEAVPYDLETICLKALEKEKWRRYPTALDLARDLERLLEGRTILAVRQGLTTRIGRGIERHRSQIFSALLPLAVVAALVALAFGPRGDPAPGPQDAWPDAGPGPIARAAFAVAAGQDGLGPLLGLVEEAGRAPGWDLVAAGLRGVPEEAAVHDLVRIERRRATGERAPAEVLGRLLGELVDDRRVSVEALSATTRTWLGPAGEPLAELVRRAALALRGARHLDADAYRAALRGPRSALDPAIVLDLRRRPFSPRLEVAAVTSDAGLIALAARRRLLPERVGRRVWLGLPAEPGAGGVDDGADVTFPPALLPDEPPPPGPPLPVVRGLLEPGAALPLAPTDPLLLPDGARLAVGWLRFLWLLEDARPPPPDPAAPGPSAALPTPRVLARVRLPGLAVAIDHAADGGVEVRVWDGAAARSVRVDLGGASPEPGAGPEPGAPPRLTWSDGRPVTPLELVPATPGLVHDELRRLAAAELPELDDLLEVHEEVLGPAGEPEVRLARQVRLRRPHGRPLRLGFEQEGPTPCLSRAGARASRASRVRAVEADGPLARGLLEGTVGPGTGFGPRDRLLELEPPEPGRDAVVLHYPHGVKDRWLKVGFRLVDAAPDWDAVVARAAAVAARDPAPNPWALLHEAAARAARAAHAGGTGAAGAGGPGAAGAGGGEGPSPAAREAALAAAGALAARAQAGPELSPLERVEAAALLDRHGLEGAADRAIRAALADLVGAHGYAPDLAGYGPRDAGRALALRVEEALLLEGRPARARTLARWRDALAPALAESGHARALYARRGVAPPEARERPKGVAGLGTLEVVRFHHVNLALASFLPVVVGLLVLTAVKYRKHAVRDLERVGVKGWRGRLGLWVRRPRTRLGFALPTYVTTPDKLAIVLLYVVYFLGFAVQDAGLVALAGLERNVDGPLNGLPGLPLALRRLDATLAAAPDDARVAHQLAWGLRAAGLDLDPTWAGARDRAERLLRARGQARDHLLLAELALARADREGARAALERAAGGPPSVAAAATLLRARLAAPPSAGGPAGSGPDGPGPDPALAPALAQARDTLARWAPRHALALELRGALAAPLAPPPSPAERDHVVVGADPWWTPVPGLVVRSVARPLESTAEDAVRVFESAWRLDLSSARLRNRLFWLVPGSLVLLIAWLFVPTPRLFEPLPSDLDPPRLVAALRLLVPGVFQWQTGRPVRGVLLLLPFSYVAHVLWGYEDLSKFAELRIDPALLAQLTAENVSAVREVYGTHAYELLAVLGGLYALHWVDLALARRKVFRPATEGPRREADEDDAGADARAPRPARPPVIPVDSLDGAGGDDPFGSSVAVDGASASALPGPGARRTAGPPGGSAPAVDPPDGPDGPFDRTEPRAGWPGGAPPDGPRPG